MNKTEQFINDIIEHDITKKNPDLITLAMINEKMDVKTWFQNIIQWTLIDIIEENEEKYVKRVFDNMLLGIERMSQDQHEQLCENLKNLTITNEYGNNWARWWRYNEILATKKLVNFKVPTQEIKKQLTLLKRHLKQNRNISQKGCFNFTLGLQDIDKESIWMANQHPVLASALWKHILQNTTSTAMQDNDVWIKLIAQDWSWLKNANITDTIENINLKRYCKPITTNGSQQHQLVLMTALLPKMNAKDRSYIAPISTWVFGKNSVNSFQPIKFKNIWKALEKEYIRPVPRQYKGDTYMLYVLTGSDATALKGILDSLDLKDLTTYLNMTRQWMIANTPELAKEIHKTPEIQVDTSLF